MTDRARDFLQCLIPLVLASILFFWGIDWGLPTRDVDSKLFGNRTPWTGAEILALLEQNQPVSTHLGADVDATPKLDRSKPIILNDTDAKRAEIVQRYRLMSGQPDEFIQFKALAEMGGRSGIDRFDPRLYQYGGLWIYPVGALLKVCSFVGLVELKSDRAFYLDHPEAFGRFYVVARCYSALWGLVLVWAVFQITRKIANNLWLSTVGAILIALTPVVMSSAQEAKPHLAGAALTLLAVLAAARHVETGKAKWSLLACALCAMAASMVLSAILACAVLPAMVWLERKNRIATGETGVPPVIPENDRRDACPTRPVWKDCLRLFEMFLLVAILFTIFNPFLVYNGVFRPELLKSNLGNSAAMYGISIRGVWRAIEILGAAMTWVVMITAVIGAIVLIVRQCKGAAHEVSGFETGAQSAYFVRGSFWDRISHKPIMPLLITTTIPTLVMFVLLANDKPMEFARFGIVVCACAMVIACSGFSRICREWMLWAFGTFVVLSAGTSFVHIWAGTMIRAGDIGFYEGLIEEFRRERATVGLWHEPAPWSSPPLNLFDFTITLLPENQMQENALHLAPHNLSSPIQKSSGFINWKYNTWDWGPEEMLMTPPTTSNAATEVAD